MDSGVGCWVCFSGLLGLLPVDCVDSGVGCWVCFSGLLGLLLVDWVDSGVIPVWVAGLFFWFAGFVAGGLGGFRCDTDVGRWLCR